MLVYLHFLSTQRRESVGQFWSHVVRPKCSMSLIWITNRGEREEERERERERERTSEREWKRKDEKWAHCNPSRYIIILDFLLYFTFLASASTSASLLLFHFWSSLPPPLFLHSSVPPPPSLFRIKKRLTFESHN